MRLKWIFPFLVLVAACGDSKTDTTDTAVSQPDVAIQDTGDGLTEDVAALDTAPDAQEGCWPGTLDETCTSVQWSQLDDYPHPIDHHGTIVHVGDDGVARLYVMGGFWQKSDNTYAVFDEVRRAPILANHQLGAWETEAPLPDKLAFHGVAATADHVYLVAGMSVDQEGIYGTNAVYVGSFGPEGQLTFAAATNEPSMRIHPSLSVVGTRLVVTGGSRQVAVDSVQSAPLAADGTVGPWTEDEPFPSPRSHHATVVHDGRVWVFGGYDSTTTPAPDILVSVHDDDGRVVAWNVAGQMDAPPWTAGVTLYKDGVLVIGGGEGGPNPAEMAYTDRVRFARWDADGVLGPFSDVKDPLLRARAHVHQDPLHAGFLYSVGGRVQPSGTSIGEVHVGYLGW